MSIAFDEANKKKLLISDLVGITHQRADLCIFERDSDQQTCGIVTAHSFISHYSVYYERYRVLPKNFM